MGLQGCPNSRSGKRAQRFGGEGARVAKRLGWTSVPKVGGDKGAQTVRGDKGAHTVRENKGAQTIRGDKRAQKFEGTRAPQSGGTRVPN